MCRDPLIVRYSPQGLYCERHRNTARGPTSVPEKLQSLLAAKELQILTPIAMYHGLGSDRELENILVSARNPLFQQLLPEYANVTSYDRRLLELVLRELAGCKSSGIKQE